MHAQKWHRHGFCSSCLEMLVAQASCIQPRDSTSANICRPEVAALAPAPAHPPALRAVQWIGRRDAGRGARAGRRPLALCAAILWLLAGYTLTHPTSIATPPSCTLAASPRKLVGEIGWFWQIQDSNPSRPATGKSPATGKGFQANSATGNDPATGKAPGPILQQRQRRQLQRQL